MDLKDLQILNQKKIFKHRLAVFKFKKSKDLKEKLKECNV
jgi:hypothetical protein